MGNSSLYIGPDTVVDHMIPGHGSTPHDPVADVEAWDFESGVLEPPLSRARVVRIASDPASGLATASVQLDANVFMLDRFGDIAGSTKMLCRPHTAKLELLACEDGKSLYDMKIDDYDGPALRLVRVSRALPGDVGARVLILGEDDRIERVVELHPVPHASAAPRPETLGVTELTRLGHLLETYLEVFGNKAVIPRYLEITERVMKGLETCATCGVSVNMGDFTIEDRDSHRSVALPFLAVHALTDHDDACYRGSVHEGAVPVAELASILHRDERALGELITRLVARAIERPDHVHLEEHLQRSLESCKICGDVLNTGIVRLTNHETWARVELRFVAIHALVEHADAHYAGTVHDGIVTLANVFDLLGHAERYRSIGQRIDRWLTHGDAGAVADKPPEWIAIEEQPLRGIERCARCRGTANMGQLTIRNTAIGDKMVLPYVAVHSLAKDSNAYYLGELHSGWLDMRRLARIVESR